jgi:hypothetical protein
MNQARCRVARRVALSLSALAAGSSPALAQTPLFSMLDVNEFGVAVAYVGDVDGDGRGDFAVGAPRDSTTQPSAGRVELRSGATGLPIHVTYGSIAGARYGARLAAAGDIDLDGFPDLLASSLESAATATAGAVRGVRGTNGQTLFEVSGVAATPGFGRAIAGGKDTDGDGIPDFLVGAPLGDRGFLLDGGSNAAMLELSGPLGSACTNSVDFAPDLDGDQRADVLIGAPGLDFAAVRSSASGQYLRMFTAPAGQRFGTAVASVPDVDGDGKADFAISAPRSSENGPSAGRVDVRSSANGALLSRFLGLGGYELGTALAAAGDLDGDGRGDYFVGSAFADLSFGVSAKNAQTLMSFPGDGSPFGFGGVIAAGDLDADGKANAIVGSAGNSPSPVFALAVKAYKSCGGPITYLGGGCAAPNGVIPRLDASGCAKKNGYLALRVSGGNQPIPALILAGGASLAPGAMKLPGGCSLLVSNIVPATFAMPLSAQTLGSGEKTIFINLPFWTPSGTVHLQALLPESTGLAATNALRIEIP